jgi:hypothetical protein
VKLLLERTLSIGIYISFGKLLSLSPSLCLQANENIVKFFNNSRTIVQKAQNLNGLIDKDVQKE